MQMITKAFIAFLFVVAIGVAFPAKDLLEGDFDELSGGK